MDNKQATSDRPTLHHFLRTAASQRRLAESSDTWDERCHHLLEAERFDELASMWRADPAKARRAYRPVRAYEPAAEASVR